MKDESPSSAEFAAATFSHMILQPEEFERAVLMFVGAVASVFTVPLELPLRRRFGTRYIKALTFFAGISIYNMVALFSVFGFQPGHHHSLIPPAVATMIVSMAVYAGLFIHGTRIRKWMLNMDMEAHSESDGYTHSIFMLLPRPTWAKVRCVYEPLAVLAATAALYGIGFMPFVLTCYFSFGALCLTLKNSIDWYKEWLAIRTIRDQQNNATELQRVALPKAKARNQTPTFMVAAQ